MKTPLVYGFGIAAAGALLTFAEFFAGFHTDAEKMSSLGWWDLLLRILIAGAGLALAMRAVRESSPTRTLSYGQGLATGALTSVVSSVLGAVFLVLYRTMINPQYADTEREVGAMMMRRFGMSEEMIEQSQQSRPEILSHPLVLGVMAVAGGIFFGVVVSLVVAAFMKRKPAAPPLPTGAM